MPKPAKGAKIFNPIMLILAAMAGWAAAHEPAQFGLASIGVWALGSFTVALLTAAGLALFAPLLSLISAVFTRTAQTIRQGGGEG